LPLQGQAHNVGRESVPPLLSLITTPQTAINCATSELSPDGEGDWHHSILHTFTSGSDGNYPAGGVVMDGVGHLYGTTALGGDPRCSCGVVYEMSPGKDSKWTYTVLHTFVGSDGVSPAANLIFDDYGTCTARPSTAAPAPSALLSSSRRSRASSAKAHFTLGAFR